MPVIHLLLLNDDNAFTRQVTRALSAEDDIKLTATVACPAKAMELLREGRPHVVLVNLATVDRSALENLMALRDQLSPAPRLLGVGHASDEAAVWDAVNAGLDYCIMRPFDTETLLRRVRQVVSRPFPGQAAALLPAKTGYLEKQVAKTLSMLGVPQELKGYTYLVEAITAAVRRPDLINAVTSRLYPLVAARCQSTPRRVERAIRTCIEATWSRGNMAALEQLFAFQVDPQRGKPTNAAFIARIATEIRLRRAYRSNIAGGPVPPA